MLVLTAMVWGGSFVAQKSGMELIGPFAFNGIRTIIGGIVLIPLIMVLDRMKSKKQASAPAARLPARRRLSVKPVIRLTESFCRPPKRWQASILPFPRPRRGKTSAKP